MSDYLQQHGEALLDAGYTIVPIAPGEKAPRYHGWQKTQADHGVLREWLRERKGRYGIGILTKNTPAVDIDIMDEEVAEEVAGWFQSAMRGAPVRVGRAPKRLLLYRTTNPFPKLRSSVWFDEWDEKQQIEILGDGQQFVAYHTHPETRLPYQWIANGEPLDTPADELPELDVQLARDLLRRFDELAREKGWTLARKARRPLADGIADPDDPFIEDTPPVDLSPEEIRERTLSVGADYAEDYDHWVQFGMALYHQFDGSVEGLDIWHEWSEQAHNYDADALDARWEEFAIEGKGRQPITARYILKLANEASDLKAQAAVIDMRDAFRRAADEAEWREVCNKAKKLEVDSVTRASFAVIAQETYQRVTGLKISKADALKAIRYEFKPENAPRWCASWVYDTETDRFVHTKQLMAITTYGFNALNDRYAAVQAEMMEGARGRASASELALKTFKIPVVAGQRYAPGHDRVHFESGVPYVNTYSTKGMPEKPSRITERDRRNVALVEGHIAHLLEDQREQSIFLDFIAYVVQNPGKRINWAILLQGVEGDGKSFWSVLLRAVMGFHNVRNVNGSMLEERFTDWAEGQCLVCIEEIRMIGHNRYDAMNRVKPFITNDIVEIHPKGQKSREITNTSNYLLFTNYQDALPLDDNSRRYCVLFSRWQRKADLAEFMKEKPSYYINLYRAIEQSAGAIREWLLEHEFSEHFQPRGNAPMTTAQAAMAGKSKPEFLGFVDDLIDDRVHEDITPEIVNLTKAFELYRLSGVKDGLPNTARLQSMMENAGYVFLGRIRAQRGEEKTRYYSRTIGAGMNIEKTKKAIVEAIDRGRENVNPDAGGDGFDDL